MSRIPSALRHSVAVVSVAALALVGLSLPAAADTAPVDPADPRTPVTVAADALPTVQIDGVVWSQVVVGDIVYAAGKFTAARPAGAAAGTSTVPRTHLLAYNITTGELVPGFAPVLDGQARSITRSPDGSRIYVVGDFNKIDGQWRVRAAAFDTATNTLVSSFRPTLASSALSVAATNTTVYVGGNFTSAASVTGGALQPRSYLAAFNASNGNLTTFQADTDAPVTALAVNPAQTKLVVGGRFTDLNGADVRGLGAVDPTTGAPVSFPASDQIEAAGPDSAITSLYADASGIYGTAYHYGDGGNLEGPFRADPATGELVWVADCHGDAYSVFPSGDAVYGASHHHYCGNMGGFPQTEPWTFYHGNAFSKAATGTNTPDIYGYPDHDGEPSPSMLNWYPTFIPGSFTGQGQAGWSVAGNDQYVVYGGEFKGLNGQLQQGLVRFAVPAKASNTQGPRLSGNAFDPSISSRVMGEVRLSMRTNWDRDNETLTYKLYRGKENSTPIWQETITTPFWKPQSRVFTDTGLAPGSSQKYRVTATDAFGNIARSNWLTITVNATDTLSPYADAVLGDGVRAYWRLGETAGPTVEDWAGTATATAGTGVTFGRPDPIGSDTNTAAAFNGTTNGRIATTTAIDGPQTFAIETWFRTTSTTGGKLVGFGNRNSGNSSSYDRHVYMSTTGRVLFGVYPGSERTISSPTALNDGAWHHVVASMGPDGMKLYVDGTRVAQRTDTTSAQAYTGYWRIGGDSAWSGAANFTGDIDEVAIYDAPLTAAQVDEHWTASGRTSNVAPAPADAYGAAVFGLQPDLYWRLGEATGATAADSGPSRFAGTYSGNVVLGATGALTGQSGTAVRFPGTPGGLVASKESFVNPTVYSEELWFRTTTTTGGKLIGFGSSATGVSGSYDRHVYMEDDGRLTFGAYTGETVTLSTSNAYNDGGWHHVVAAQSGAGMRLYVDGELKGSNTNAAAQSYTGFWRVGGDNTWGPQPWFTGTIDEAAVYPVALTAEQVAQHYQLGSGNVPNTAPAAAFTPAVTDLDLTVDASASTDADGTIGSYAWDFGDSSTGTGATASHTYAAGGTYTVTLTVTDNDGATATTSQVVTVVAPNQLPDAAFEATTDGLDLDVDGSASSDPDGTLASHAWDFGDGGTATGASASHRYTAGGTFTVTLTVTDDRGGVDTSSQDVTITPPPGPVVFAADSFTRSAAAGWGTSDVGGAWAHYGASTLFPVAGDAGQISLTKGGSGPRARLADLAVGDVDVTATVGFDKLSNAGSNRLTLSGRTTGWTSEYQLKVNVSATGTIASVQLGRRVDNVESLLGSTTLPGTTMLGGERMHLRLQLTGSGTTTLRAKVWKVGTPEPEAWLIERTDATPALQVPGSVGVAAYTAASTTNVPIAVSWDDLLATSIE